MTARRIVVGSLALGTLVLIALSLRREISGADSNNPGAPTTSPPAAAGFQSAIRNPPSAIAPSAEPSDLATLGAALNSPRTDIRADLRIVSGFLTTYRSNFPRNGNPVGSNAEITAALTGRNRLHLALLPPDHPAINRDGELCDRWGTPFFFHAESGTRMALRSAGPDRKMWTDDDVVLEP
jgi:hypothetical protein